MISGCSAVARYRNVLVVVGSTGADQAHGTEEEERAGGEEGSSHALGGCSFRFASERRDHSLSEKH
eukprot:408948-Rhodomonas_salina.2